MMEGYVTCGASCPTDLEYLLVYLLSSVLCILLTQMGVDFFLPLQINLASFDGLLCGENDSHFRHIDIGQIFRSLSWSSSVALMTYRSTFIH